MDTTSTRYTTTATWPSGATATINHPSLQDAHDYAREATAAGANVTYNPS